MDEKDKIIKDAQYRKGLSIAYFNSVNAAIEMTKVNGLVGVDAKKFIAEWRDWFLEEHKGYYAATIAQIGVPYNPAKSVEWVLATKNVDDLKAVFINMSEDERRDPAILEAVRKQKASLQVQPKKSDEKA